MTVSDILDPRPPSGLAQSVNMWNDPTLQTWSKIYKCFLQNTFCPHEILLRNTGNSSKRPLLPCLCQPDAGVFICSLGSWICAGYPGEKTERRWGVGYLDLGYLNGITLTVSSLRRYVQHDVAKARHDSPIFCLKSSFSIVSEGRSSFRPADSVLLSWSQLSGGVMKWGGRSGTFMFICPSLYYSSLR